MLNTAAACYSFEEPAQKMLLEFKQAIHPVLSTDLQDGLLNEKYVGLILNMTFHERVEEAWQAGLHL